MFNIVFGDDSIPSDLQIFVISERALCTRLSECRHLYLQLGWNIWKENNRIYFLNLNSENIGNPPEYLEEVLDESYPFKEINYQWNENLFSRNAIAFAMFATLKYRVNLDLHNQIRVPTELGLRRRRREFLFPKPIKYINGHPIYEGISLRPILLSDEDIYFPAFIIDRIIRTTPGIAGTPWELQQLSSIKSHPFFNRLYHLFEIFQESTQNLCLGTFQFSLNKKLAELNIIQIGTEEQFSDEFVDEPYFQDDEEEIYADYDENVGEEQEDIEKFVIPREILDQSLPIIPKSLPTVPLEEAALTVGSDFKRRNMTTMYMLDEYGPFSIRDGLTVIFIPLYFSNQQNIRKQVKDFCSNLINGVQVNHFRFPGLNNGFDITAQTTSPYDIPMQFNEASFRSQIENIIMDVRKKYPHLENQYNHLSNVIPFFVFGQLPEKRTRRGQYTPTYRFVKQQLTRMGIPNQTVVQFDKLNQDKWRIFPLWSVASQIFSKVGGVPWVIDSRLDKNNNPIHAIVGLRFAKRFDPTDKRKYVLGILSIITGDGRFVGFITNSFDYDEEIEEYNWLSRQYGLNRYYDGLKLSQEDVNTLCNNIISFLNDKMHLADQPGSIVIHRLGLIPAEERREFMNCFNQSNYTMALISVSNFSLHYCPNEEEVRRGTLFKIDNDLAYLFTQGVSQFNTSPSRKKNFTPRSCPSVLKIKRIADTGVYTNVVDAAIDIFSLTRMNWRHTTYIPSNYPISLQYALLVAQNLKNGIEPMGDYRDVPWFL